MATSATKTVKISQTIMLDIDFSKIESVRIVDVDLLILLKDGQRLIVPEGAVRAMMDNEFSINFKGRVFSVASLMELQTFQAQRVTEVGIASKPGLPEKSEAPGVRDVQRIDLSGDPDADASEQTQATAEQPPAATPMAAQPAIKASTEADAQARDTASALDRQTEASTSQQPASAPADMAASRAALPAASAEPLTATANASGPGKTTAPAADASISPESAGLSSAWKYAVGVLGAGLAAVAGRAGAKAVDAVADITKTVTDLATSDATLTGVLAMGPFKQGTQLKVVVRGMTADGKTLELANAVVSPDANSKYSVTLDPANKNYTGQVVVVLTDVNSATPDFKDEATGQDVAMDTLTLRSVGYITKAGATTTLNITPLTELAVRSVLGSISTTNKTLAQKDITQANTVVAKAFGLGTNVDVTTAAVKTVLDTGFDPTDASVGTRYALALAALSGVDAQQSKDKSSADRANATLNQFAANFTTPSATASATLSQDLIETLFSGALTTQPVVQEKSGSTTLNVPALLAKQIAEVAATASSPKILALVASSVATLGSKGTTIEFHFDQAVPGFTAGDVKFSKDGKGTALPGYETALTSLTKLDEKGLRWSAKLVPPHNASGTVVMTFNHSGWSGNNWMWTVDVTPPDSPTSITLAAATDTTPASDSGISATDHISQVKTPTVRVTLNSDAAVGDVVIVRQLDKTTLKPILGSDAKARNEVSKVLTASDVGTGSVDIKLNDLGADGNYSLSVTQQDAAGNESTLNAWNYTDYTLDTHAPGALALSHVTAGLINFGGQTPLGLVNAQTKQAGFVLKGTGGEAGCTVSVIWGANTLTAVVDDQGNWSVSVDGSKIPADNKSSLLTITQTDVAGNVSAATTYAVEVNTAGVTAKVASVSVSDDSGAVGPGAYTVNAQGVLVAGQSTDDHTPVVTVKLDRPLYTNEVIEVYDGVRTAQSTPLFTLKGDYTSIEDKLYAWTFNTANWSASQTLAAGAHTLTARVVNTHTLDVGVDLDVTARPSFVVQALDFNQLLVKSSSGEEINQIPPNHSAGSAPIVSMPSNKPLLAGTLQTALGLNERLAVYDGDTYLGNASPIPTSDVANPGGYTWQFQIQEALSNGDHTLSVRLESLGGATPVVRLAMAQSLSFSLPVLSIAPQVEGGVANDTGWSSTDGYSSNRTPTLRLTLPQAGYQAGDIITLKGKQASSSVVTDVALYALTQQDLDRGFADITTNSLGSLNQPNRVWSLWAVFDNTVGGLQVSQTAAVTYELDTTAPDLPAASDMGLLNDTSGGQNTTRDAALKSYSYDASSVQLQYKIIKDGKTIQDYTDAGANLTPQLTADGKYSVLARLVDKAGNYKSVTFPSTLGTGVGYVNFVLDTTAPLALAKPTLLVNSTNGLPLNAADNITSNFLLKDPNPATETNARLQYTVQRSGSASDKVVWYASYLDAMGAANGLTGDALSSWETLASGTTAQVQAAAAQLKEGLYTVTRRQVDVAGNISPEVSMSFQLNVKANPITVSLHNDTSAGKKVSSDVNVDVSGVEGVAGVDVVLTYTLTRYTDGTRKSDGTRDATKQVGSPIITTVTASNPYKPPTTDGYYTLEVKEVNRAGLVSTGTLDFQLDTTKPAAPGAITLDTNSNTARHAFDGDLVGTADIISSVTAPTVKVVLPTGANAPRAGDYLQLFLNGDVNQPWGSVTLSDADISAHMAQVGLNQMPSNDEGIPIDGSYGFKARLVDEAGNVSDWSAPFTYTLDSVALAPTLHPVQLDKLPANFINHQSSVTFTGTGESLSRVTLTWTSTDSLGNAVEKTFQTDVSALGAWSLTVNAADFPPDTARLAYTSTVTVSQVDPSGNVSMASTPLNLALNTSVETTTVSITSLTDNNTSHVASGAALPSGYYAVDPSGALIAKGQTTDEHQPLLSGTLSAELPAVQLPDGRDQVVVRVYDGATLLGHATVSGLTWTFQTTSPLTDGGHYFTAEVFDPLTLQTGHRSDMYAMSSNVLTLTAYDTNVAHKDNWVITNTSKPTLQGTLKAVLALDEALAVYDQQPDGSFALLGTVNTSNLVPTSGGWTWSFDMPKAMFGQHTYRVQVEKRTQGSSGATVTPLMAIDQAVKYDFNSITIDPLSDTGRSDSDSISQVKTPNVLVHLSGSAQVGDAVVLTVATKDQPAHVITEAEKAAGTVSLTAPNLYELINGLGEESKDGLFTISATVGGVSVVSPVYYQLDTTAPEYQPEVQVKNATGKDTVAHTDTGYTADKTLLSLTVKPAADKSAYEQVQVVATNSGAVVNDWISVADFNSSTFTLADGDYTLHSRIVDIAGNVDLKTGNDVTLRLDTHAAQVSSLTPLTTAATTQALQQDAYLNQAELGGVAQFKLVFTEKVKGLTLDHLQLVVSGADATRPTLDAITPVNLDANGYASEWQVSVKDLGKLTHGETLQVTVKNGLNVVDQAGNHNDALSYTADALTVDNQAAFGVSSVTTLSTLRSLLKPGSSSLTVNGLALQEGLRVSGTTTDVESGQPITVSLLGKDSSGQYTVLIKAFDAVSVTNGQWTIDLPQSDLSVALQDKTDYALHVALQDKAGNSATGVTLAVLSRLSASIDIDKVVANNLEASGQDGTVLNFDTEDMSVTPDSYINAKEKSVGSLDTGDTSSMGFTVHGISNIGAGQIVTVQLWQPDKSIAPVLGSGTVDDKGEWSVYFSSGSVGNLTDGQWQLKATGEDKDGNQAAQNEHSVVAFTVDTLASVGLNPIGGDAHRINLTQDGSTLTVSGTFSNIDAGNTLTLALRDKNAANPTQVIQTWTLAPADLVLHTEGAITTWTYHIPLATLDALHFAHAAGASQADVAKLSLTASSLDLAGNPAADSLIFELDRTPPAAPGAGVAIRQVAGSTLEAGSTTSLNSATTLHDPNQGVLIAPHAEAPTAGDIASITVEGTQVFAATDKWRLGTHVWRMDTAVTDTSVALGSGAASFGVTYSYDKVLARLVIKANGSSFTSAQVQTVMSGLAWVNTSADNELDQLDRQFTVSYTDAFGNVGAPTTITFNVDTNAPTAPTAIQITPIGGVVTSNTLNGTNTSMSFAATVLAGEATSGRADFYVGSRLIGSDTSIGAADTSVTLTMATSSNAALKGAIPEGGEVMVKLYDAVGNVVRSSSASDPTLVFDVTAPVISSITSDKSNNSFKQGEDIALTLTTSEDIETAGSTLTVTLTTGNTVVLTRGDDSHKNQFTGHYIVPAGVSSAALNVTSVALGATQPRDKAGNTLRVSTLPADASNLINNLIVIDTQPPVAPTNLTFTSTGGTSVSNTLNGTNTAMTFSATITANDATGGKAEFYITTTTGSGPVTTLIGTDASITASKTTVSYTTEVGGVTTSTPAALQSKITAGGVVSVKLYDKAGNMVSTSGDTLTIDVAPPVVTRITSSTTDGWYKAGADIALRLETDEDIAGDGSTLVVTLNTGTPGSPATPDRTVTLTRDATNKKLFTGTYTVQAGDTSADLNVSSVSLNSAAGAIAPRDAAGNPLNLSIASLATANTLAGNKALVIDTTAPTTLTDVAITAAVTGAAGDGTVVTHALNATNTAMKFSATIGAGEATGGYADFYIGATKIGTSSTIGASDTTVAYTTEVGGVTTSTSAALQSKITAGGVVSVKLYDKAGNLLSVDGPTLVRDVAAPTVTKLTSSATDGAYKEGDAIALRLETDEDIAGDGSTLVVTLNTGTPGSPATPDRTVTLTRDTANKKLFTGTYTVQAGDTSADLNISSVSLNAAAGAMAPQDAADNALNMGITSLATENTLAGSKAIVIDTTAPHITRITSSTTDGWYKAGASIDLRLETNEDIAGAGSTLVVTLATGTTGTPGSPGTPDRTVTLTRDTTNKKLFTGTYTVQAGDNSTDLNVSNVSLNPAADATAPKDAAGNGLNLSTASLATANTLAGSKAIVVDTTAPAAIDLVSGGDLNTTGNTVYTVAMAGSDVALVGSVGLVSETDVVTLHIAVNGADGLNDVLTFGTVNLALSTTADSGSTSVAGVGVDWAYSADKVLTLTKTGGGVFAAADIQAIESHLTFKTYLATPTGARTFAFTHVDQVGNIGAVSTQAITVDAIAPNAPDLEALAGIQRTGSTYYGAADVGTSKAIAPQVDATQDDIAQITVTVGGVVDSNDTLWLGDTSQALNPTTGGSATDVTINGVAHVNWNYTTGKVLTLTRQGGGAFTAAQIRDIERGLKLSTAPGATPGARTFTLLNTDTAGNASASSVLTFLVDVVAPAVSSVAVKGYTSAGVPRTTLGVGDQLRAELTMSEAVVVDTSLGTPTYNLVLDTGGTVQARYTSGSGTHTLVFTYTVAPTNSDSAGGVTTTASPLILNGATVKDLAGNALSLAALPALTVNTLRVDTLAPAPVTDMAILDTSLPESTGGTVKVQNSSLFQVASARGFHWGYRNGVAPAGRVAGEFWTPGTSEILIQYRQDDGTYLQFSFLDQYTFTGFTGGASSANNILPTMTTQFNASSLGLSGLFKIGIDGSSGTGYSFNNTLYPNYLSSGDGLKNTGWLYLQANPGKVIDASRLSIQNTFYYWLPTGTSPGVNSSDPITDGVTYETAIGWGNSPPSVPGGATVVTSKTGATNTTSTTQITVKGHGYSSSGGVGNGWLYQYQGATASTPTNEGVVDTVVDNRLLFDFSALTGGGIAKATVFNTVNPSSSVGAVGYLTGPDSTTVLNYWLGKFTPAAGVAAPTLAELFGAVATWNATASSITASGGSGYMVSYKYASGSSTLVSQVIIDVGATSSKDKLLGGTFTFGTGASATILKLPTTWATEGGTQTIAMPTFDITLPAGVEEGAVIKLYDGTTGTGTLIGTKYLTAADITKGYASLTVSADTPFANATAGPVTHSLSAKVTDNAGNVATNDGFYSYIFQDTTRPTVRSVKVWGANSDRVAKTSPLVAGDQVMVTVGLDEAVLVTGVPTFALDIGGVPHTASYVSTSGKEMVFAYTVAPSDTGLGVTASTSALALAGGSTIQDASGNAINLTTPAVALIDNAVVVANPRGALTGVVAEALAAGDSQPHFSFSYDGTQAQVGDRLAIVENGVQVGTHVLTSSDVSAGSHTIQVKTDSSLLQGTHALTFHYIDNTGADTAYAESGSVVTKTVTIGSHDITPVVSLDSIQVNNEGRQTARVLSDWSTYQSVADPDLVFTGTVNQAATVTVYATSTTTGVVQEVGHQALGANETFSISETAFSLTPDVYNFKVTAVTASGQVASVSTSHGVGVLATSTGADTISGTAGNDRINAGEGVNTLSTGGGQDTVFLGGYLNLASNTGASTTTITDFKVGQDKLDLSGVFAPGAVNTSNFLQFVSQSVSGADTTLTIDSNGSAAGGTLHSVILKNVTSLPMDSTVFNYVVL